MLKLFMYNFFIITIVTTKLNVFILKIYLFTKEYMSVIMSCHLRSVWNVGVWQYLC